MKKLILAAMLVAVGLVATATTYDYPYMYFLSSDGTLQSMTVDGMTIAFADGNMVVTNSEESKSFTLTEMNKMYFAQSSGLEELIVNSDQAVEVYNEAGMLMGKYANTQQALQNLDYGIYIIRSKSTTLKIAVK